MTDESVIEWASGWIRANTPSDPTFRQRFLDGLASELRERGDRVHTLETAIARLLDGSKEELDGNLDALRDALDSKYKSGVSPK
jgi:hypothetical protein